MGVEGGEDGKGGVRILFTTLIPYQPLPLQLPVCTLGLVQKTGKDKGVHTNKAKHVTQSTQNHVFGTYTLSLIIRWQCTVPARH